MMTAIPAQSGAGVTVVILPPSSAGREEEIVAPMYPGEGALGSPVRLGLEEDEGATLVLEEMETEAGPLGGTNTSTRWAILWSRRGTKSER
jgi:hypothetical protein